MFTFVLYELKVAVILAAFYLCFKLLLSSEKLHRLNRVVLISTAVLSFVLPLCIITLHKTLPMSELAESGVIGEELTMVENVAEAASGAAWGSIAIVVYWLGVIMVLVSIAVGIARVMKLIRSGVTREMNGTEVIVCEKEVAPFSWMKWIVMCNADFESGNSHILEHEKAHIKLGHSKDVLLVDVLSALQWFNPAIWLLKRDLRAIHEYEADDAVLRKGVNIKEYQYSLIRKAVSASGYSITNSFNHSILKNRITMMSKSKVSVMRGLKVLYILPLVCGTLALNARTVIDYESSEIIPLQQKPIKVEAKSEKGKVVYFVNGEKMPLEKVGEKVAALRKANEFAMVEMVLSGDLKAVDVIDLKDELRKIDELKLNVNSVQVTASQPGESMPFQLVDVKPSFNGGDANEFSKWVNANLVYPATAKAAGIQGRVTLQFVVQATGKVTDVTVLRGASDPSLDAEAVRVVSASPDWAPGESNGVKVPVTFTFPVIFQIR